MANEQEIGKLVIRLVAEVKELKKGLTEAQKEIKGFSDQSKKTTDSFTSSIGGIQTAYLVAAAKIYAAYKLIQTAMTFLEVGAKAEQTEAAFGSLTKSMGVDGQELIRQMKEVGYTFVESTGLMIKAQRLLVEGVSPKDIVGLMESARVAARLMGVDVGEAFDRISEAVITMRTRGLKAAFSMDDQKVVEKYAESLGTIPKYLEKVAERQALVNEILRQTVEKKSFLGTILEPTTAENLEKTRSAFEEMKESVSKLVVEFVLASDALPTLIKIISTIADGAVEFKKFTSEFGFIFEAVGVGLKTVLVGVTAVFTGATAIFAGIMELNYELLSLTNFLTFNAFPALGKAVEDFGKRRDKVFESLEKQATALNKLTFGGGEKPAGGAKEPAKPLGTPLKKEQIDREKLEKDLTKFRLANEEQRVAAEANIRRIGLQIRRTQEITALKKLGEDTVMQELEWDRKIARADYEATTKSLDVKKRAEVEAAKVAGMDVADVKKKFGTLEKEAAQKLAADLGEIEAKRALSFEALTGLTEQELQKRLEYSRALKEGDADDDRRANKVKEANEARLSDQIIKNKIAEDQFAMTKEDRLNKEIEITRELMGYAQEKLNNLSEEDDAWVSVSGQVEGYKNKIKELNFELDRQTASFGQLIESGLKKYSVSLKEDLITNMETLVPKSIDAAGGAFKTFLKDVSSGTKSTSEAFKDMARSFGESIMDMIIDIGLLMIKMELLKALKIETPTAGASAGGGGGGGWIGSILSLIVGLFQTGGQIRGPSGRDRVPIRATAGEYMQPVPSVKYYGTDIMEKLRRREIPRDALIELSSGIRSGSRIKPSFAMESGGTVPSLSGAGGEEKKTEITLINVVDQREMDSWAASARGQNAIINVISSRAEKVRKVLQ